jgi:hypothetical protein
MNDSNYLRRRAVQEAELASKAVNGPIAAAHDAMAAAYFRQLANLAEQEEQRLSQLRPPEL